MQPLTSRTSRRARLALPALALAAALTAGAAPATAAPVHAAGTHGPSLTAAGQADCRPGYTAEQVGDLGGRSSWPNDIAENGTVGGTAAVSESFRPQLPFTETVRSLAQGMVPEGSTFGRVLGVTENGTSVGEVFTASPEKSQPARWDRRGRLTVLAESGVAQAANNRGDVVGSSQDADGFVAATVWSKHGTRHLAHLDRGEPGETPRSGARDVDSNGTVVGSSRVFETVEADGHDHHGHSHRHAHTHAALWDKKGRAHDLGVLMDHGTSEARGIAGRYVVGEATTADVATAVSFTSAGPVELAPTEWRFSAAEDVNRRGEAVGHGSRFRGNTNFGGAATVWCEGRAVDLNTVTDLPEGWTLSNAVAVNSRGQIAAAGKDADGRNVSLRLTPQR